MTPIPFSHAIAPFPPRPPCSAPATTLPACPRCSRLGKIDPSRTAAVVPDRLSGGRGDRAVLPGSSGDGPAPRGGFARSPRRGTTCCSTRVLDHSAGRSRTAPGKIRTTACAAPPRAPRPGPPKRWTCQLTGAIRRASTRLDVPLPSARHRGLGVGPPSPHLHSAPPGAGRPSTATPPRTTTATTKCSDFYGSQ